MQFDLFLGSQFGDVLNNFIINNVNCGGGENALLGCKYSRYHNCGVKKGAGVICSDTISKYLFRSVANASFEEN